LFSKKNNRLRLRAGLNEVLAAMTEITCFPAGGQKRLKRHAGRKKWARQIMPDWSRVRKLLLAGFPYMLDGPHHRRLIWGTANERLDEYPRRLDEGDVAEAGTGGGAHEKPRGKIEALRNGLRVSWNTVPAVGGVLPWQALHRNTPRAITQGSPVTPQHPRTNPPGHRKRRM
jgi:hypothetical protein